MSNTISRTTTGAFVAGPASVGAVTLVAGGATATCQITDATAGGGSVDIVTNLSTAANGSVSIPFKGVDAQDGVYLEAIAGSGATVIVELL